MIFVNPGTSCLPRTNADRELFSPTEDAFMISKAIFCSVNPRTATSLLKNNCYKSFREDRVNRLAPCTGPNTLCNNNPPCQVVIIIIVLKVPSTLNSVKIMHCTSYFIYYTTMSNYCPGFVTWPLGATLLNIDL